MTEEDIIKKKAENYDIIQQHAIYAAKMRQLEQIINNNTKTIMAMEAQEVNIKNSTSEIKVKK